MKRFMLTVALTCFLSISVLAGESPTCGITSTPPPPTVAAMTTMGDGDTDSATVFGDISDLLAAVVLEIITWP